MTLTSAVRSLGKSGAASLRDLLFPPVCTVCRSETSEPGSLCANCWRELAFLSGTGCRYCGRPIAAIGTDPDELVCDSCHHLQPVWHYGRAVFRYNGTGRKLILGLKHADRLDRVPMLATWALRQAGDLLDDEAVLIPVPLHWTRRLKRRSNQSAELARALASRSPVLRYAPEALVRHRKTGSQDGRNRNGRIANVAGAFSPGRTAAKLRGTRAIVVDDVMTTGATLNAVAQACLDLGASRVDVIVLALVIRDGTDYMAPSMEDETYEAS
ncbi:MAG: ComF family protein [Pseudomonadota bacterium]